MATAEQMSGHATSTGLGREERPKKYWLDVGKHYTPGNGLTTWDTEEHLKWGKKT